MTVGYLLDLFIINEIRKEKMGDVLDPDVNHDLNRQNGFYLREIGKYEESRACFKRVLEIDPKHLATLNNLGLLFKKIKDYDEALKCFEKVINIDSNFLKAYNNIGTISLELGNIKNAIFNYKKVLQLDPNNFISYQNLLAAYENSNQIDNYQKTLKLIEKKYTNEKIIEI